VNSRQGASHRAARALNGWDADRENVRKSLDQRTLIGSQCRRRARRNGEDGPIIGTQKLKAVASKFGDLPGV
jgi:hypothetical protein